MKRALALGVALVLAVFVLAWVRGGPPDRVAGPFDRDRARALQRELSLLGPRPTGSEANAAGRKLLRAALEQAGLTVEERDGFACGRHGTCAFVHDLVARRPGTDPAATAVLLMAHHDSVGASPGASDDGVGAAAVVEAARALGERDKSRRPLLVVLTAAEEDGLLGAEAFAKDHPPIFAAVNVDARGGRGPSCLFETSPDSAWLVSLAARAFEHPVTSSLFYEVYRRMPNDTDFTVVKPFTHGVSLANVAGIEAYHTPQDDLEHADVRTLGHHGAQVVALARELLDAPDAIPSGEAVWFDVLSLGIVRWPASWSLALALSALSLVLGRVIHARAWGKGIAAAPAVLLGATLLPALAGFALRVRSPWFANPAPAIACLHLASTGAAAAIVPRIGGSPRAVWTGVWTLWALAGVALAVVAPGASFLFVVPAIAAGLLAWGPELLFLAVPPAIAAVLWAPVALTIPDALGFAIPTAIAIPTALLATTLAPLLLAPPRHLAFGALFASLLALVASHALPRYTPEVPQRVNVVHAEESGGTEARVLVAASWGAAAWGTPPRALLHGDEHVEILVPWLAPGPVRRAPKAGIVAPVVEAIRRQDGSAFARLRSPRGAPSLVLELPAERRMEVWVHGQHATKRWGNLVVIRGVPREGVDVELRAEDRMPIDLTLYDITRGLPAPVDRPLNATQTQDGDSTVASSRAKL